MIQSEIFVLWLNDDTWQLIIIFGQVMIARIQNEIDICSVSAWVNEWSRALLITFKNYHFILNPLQMLLNVNFQQQNIFSLFLILQFFLLIQTNKNKNNKKMIEINIGFQWGEKMCLIAFQKRENTKDVKIIFHIFLISWLTNFC